MIESELKRGKGCVGSCFSEGAVDGWPDKGAAQRAKSKGHPRTPGSKHSSLNTMKSIPSFSLQSPIASCRSGTSMCLSLS